MRWLAALLAVAGLAAGVANASSRVVRAADSPDCHASQTDSPQTIPVGGGQQTITVTAGCNSRHDNWGFALFVPPGIAGIGLGSASLPAALPKGVQVSQNPDACQGQSPAPSFCWGASVFGDPGGGSYTFTITIDMPNPFGVPFDQILQLGQAASDGSAVVEKDLYNGTQWRPLSYVGDTAGVAGDQVSVAAHFAGAPDTRIQGVSDRVIATFALQGQSCSSAHGFSGQDNVAGCTITLGSTPGTYQVTASTAGDPGVYPQPTALQLYQFPGGVTKPGVFQNDYLSAGVYPSTVTADFTVGAKP